MNVMKLQKLLCFLVLISLPLAVRADTLKRAEISQIINQVGVIEPGVGERPATVNDVVEGKRGVRTGQKSRAELIFSDRTLTRLGANTIFNFEDGTRNMDMEEGTLLLQVPKNAGGATIRTAAVTAAVTGTTILFEYTPGPNSPKWNSAKNGRNLNPGRGFIVPDSKSALAQHGYIKAMVLEGQLKVWLKNNLGESILIGPGQMIIIADTADTIPDPVDFDIETVVATSKLVKSSFWTKTKRKLEFDLITQAMDEQKKRKRRGNLIQTNLFIDGRGTTVLMANAEKLRQNRADLIPIQTPIPRPSPTPESTPSSTPTAKPTPTPTPTPEPTPTPSPNPTQTPEVNPRSFILEGTTDYVGAESDATYFRGLGRFRTVQNLPDPRGGTTITPTRGNTFSILSNGGTDGQNRPITGARISLDITPDLQTVNTQKYLVLDYRVLTDELARFNGSDQGNDEITLRISSSNGTFLRYQISRSNLLDRMANPASYLRNDVGGYANGTDWWNLKLDASPLLGTSPVSLTVEILDGRDAIVDTAFAIDNLYLTNVGGRNANSDTIGSLTVSFSAPVVIGESPGEYLLPNARGREAAQPFGPGSDGGSITIFNSQDVTVNGPILADTGPNKPVSGLVPAGAGGLVGIYSDGQVTVNAPIQVSSNDPTSRRVSKEGGGINLRSTKTSGTGIQISNTGELLSILNSVDTGPGGAIYVSTEGSNILVNGGRMIADKGTVDARNSGPNSKIIFGNPEVRGNIVKIGALGDNGEIHIGAANISADTTLKLYAGSTNGSVVFEGNAVLGSASAEKIIAAKTVTVNNGVDVKVLGLNPVKIFTDNSHYSGSGGDNTTTGRFNLEGGADGGDTKPFSDLTKPGFD